MKALSYATAVIALFATAGFGYAQSSTTPAPANQPSMTTPADCPAPGSVPESQLPESCKTNVQQSTQPQMNQGAAGATGSTVPVQDMNPASSFLASSFIGQTVYSAANENVGEINDIVMDKEKGSIVAVVGVGGFLGIGEKDVVMPIDQINVAKTDANTMRLTINATREQLEAAPAFDRNVLTLNNGASGTTGITGSGAGTTAQ
jgi:sporulation protein YlmC with PRC-barrel domain